MSNPIVNFYKSTITQDWSIGTGNFYVSVKPTTSVGRLVVSPSSDSLREIIEYTSTGTDGNGDYIVISTRGVGGTTEQSHTVGEKVRMNITAEDWEDMRDDIDSIVAAGAMDASTIVKGLVEIATDAQVIAGTDTGETGAKLVATPGQIKTNYPATDIQTFASTGTWNKPTGAKSVYIKVIGGGGAGGSRIGSGGGSGGGGGSCVIATFNADDLTSTVAVTVGASVAGVTGNTNGTIGNNSSFGAYITAYGGAGGLGSSGSGGGGGGGSLSIGSAGTTTAGGVGGSPIGGVTAGGDSTFGGGGGGDGSTSAGGVGGISVYGGGGGGGANSDGSGNGGNGGASMHGGGGGGGSAGDNSGTQGTGGVSIFAGSGGRGSNGNSVGVEAGIAPGGGGGGKQGITDSGSGAGARGEVLVITYF